MWPWPVLLSYQSVIPYTKGCGFDSLALVVAYAGGNQPMFLSRICFSLSLFAPLPSTL